MSVNIASPEFKADPYPFYARLRARAPVYRVPLPFGMSAWLVTRYDDVAAVLKDERFAKDRFNAQTPQQLAWLAWVPRLFEPIMRTMLDRDPPDHTRLRPWCPRRSRRDWSKRCADACRCSPIAFWTRCAAVTASI